MSAVQISKQDYLKKYLTGVFDKKKKKKKVTRNNITKSKIIDDDIDLKDIKAVDSDELEIYDLAEEAPQVVGIVDDRPEEMRLMSEYKNTKKWKIVADEHGFEDVKVLPIGNADKSNEIAKEKQEQTSQNPDSSTAHNPRKESETKSKEKKLDSNSKARQDDSDNSPLKKVKKEKSDSDISPPRRPSKRHDSDSSTRRQSKKNYESNPRKTKKESSDSDASPPRRCKKHSLIPRKDRKEKSDSDLSPVRKSNTRRDEDKSPPRKSKKCSDSDKSPPRKSKKCSDSDKSPPRKSKKCSDSDKSPPRKTKKCSDSDKSPPRKTKKCSDSDKSPPRKTKKCSDSDQSPPRKSRKSNSGGYHDKRKHDRPSDSPSHRCPRKEREMSHKRDAKKRKSKSPEAKPGKSKNSDSASKPRSRDETHAKDDEKSKNTLSGRKAGLQNASELRKEIEEMKEREKETKVNAPGKNETVVHRDKKTGMRIDPKEEAKKQKEKDAKQTDKLAQYAIWGKGVKQVQDTQDKIKDDLYEMSKPLARYADDKDLDQMLRNKEWDGDPMLDYIRKKKKKESNKDNTDKPVYEGSYLPNRYGIRPGHRWDGVDRSNGYEKKWFEQQNAKKAREEEAYKWSTADM